MSQPASLARFAADERLPRDEEGPVFKEAWQAEAFALTVRLHEAGCFTWNEWAATLAAVLREDRARSEPDEGSHYYDHWLAALERLVTAKQVVSASDLERRKAAWTRAYVLTPHGQPVEHTGAAGRSADLALEIGGSVREASRCAGRRPPH